MGHGTADDFEELASVYRVKVVRLGNQGRKVFRELVTGPAVDSLGDGEAASIAFAVERGAIPLIDERKATRSCTERYPNLKIGSTIDILARHEVQSALGQEGLADAVFNALYYGCMRVGILYIAWVINLIGAERAAKCPSLPQSL